MKFEISLASTPQGGTSNSTTSNNSSNNSSNKDITMRRQSTNLRLVLTRISVDDLSVSKRTRSKSIDAPPVYKVSYATDAETDKDIENNRPHVERAVKRKKSQSAVQQQQKKSIADDISTMKTSKPEKKKSVASKTASAESKIHDSVDVGKNCLKRRSESAKHNQPKSNAANFTSTTNTPEPNKKKSVVSKVPPTDKKFHNTKDNGKQQEKKKRSMESSTLNNTSEQIKKKSIAGKDPSTNKKIQESSFEPRSKIIKTGEPCPQKGGLDRIIQKKKYKRFVLYDSDTEDHVAEASSLPCRRLEQKPNTTAYPDIPNDNSDIHCQSNFIVKCCLCPYRGVGMVEHYVSEHPQQEVFVSRISPKQSHMIRKYPIPNHTSHKVVAGTEAIHRFCHFCEKEQQLTVKQWIKHVAEHTGEYELKGTAKTPHKEIYFRNNHIMAYLCDRCNYAQVRLSSMEHHIEKEHASNSNDALNNIEYIRFCVVEKREPSRNSNKANSLFVIGMNTKDIHASNVCNDVKKEIILQKNQPMRTREDGYDSSCSSDTISLTASDDEDATILMKPGKSPPLLHSGLDMSDSVNDHVNVCLESIDDQDHTNVFPSIDPLDPIVLITPIMSNEPNRKENHIEELIMSEEVNEEVLVGRTQNKNRKQQSNAHVANQSRETQHTYSRPISVVISERAKNYKGIIYDTSNETVIPSTDRQINTDLNGNRFLNVNHDWYVREVNGIPKPWIQDSSPKMGCYYRSMLKTESLIAFYKCMGHACDFTTQNDKAMEQHVIYHGLSVTYKSEVMQWLECCYCAFFANGPKELVEHLQSVHGGCGYQCNRCFYRSREYSALVVHQSLFHSDSYELSNRIYQCTKRVKNYNSSDQGFIINNMKNTVPLLVCNACPSGTFYGLLSFKDHIESHESNIMTCHLCRNIYGKMELINHMEISHGIYVFQCVYCQYGTYKNGLIEHHVSVHHPERIFCYHVRNPIQTLEPYVRPRKVIPPHRFVVFSSA
ncbi:uncharacterized protein LOC125957276 isoform X2 [Anopheles darlingi]|nr:uncharacterized protein LOC125957276 isoform X2 [Anopheles darlingi]XP_049545828.1 uncharacterized protein LOC125957276 isoform X2 [Anopheles darlingi]